MGSGRGRMGAGPRGPRGALRTPASAGFRHARPSTVSRLPVCTSVLPRHARAGHAALAACRGHAGRRWRARRARLSPECASSRSLLRMATGRVRVSVGSVSLSVRAPTHVRVHTHVQMRPCAPFPRTCLGPAAGAGRAAPPCPAPLIAPQECAGCGGWGSRADTVTGSRGAGALGHQLSARDV